MIYNNSYAKGWYKWKIDTPRFRYVYPQIIHVKIVPNGGYSIKKTYEAIWVTGVISAKKMAKDLYYVDGSADINIGYSMLADQVEPYKK